MVRVGLRHDVEDITTDFSHHRFRDVEIVVEQVGAALHDEMADPGRRQGGKGRKVMGEADLVA